MYDYTFSNNESKIKADKVFFGKGNGPLSDSIENVSHGILMLTNKRLLFLYMGTGPIKENYGGLKDIAGAIGSAIIPGVDKALDVIRLGSDVLELGSDVLEYVDYTYKNKQIEKNSSTIQSLLNDANSVMLYLKDIVECECIGSAWKPCFSQKGLIKRHTKLKVRIYDEQLGTSKEDFYCLYSINPKYPDNINSAIRWDKWAKEIMNAKGNLNTN